jgi:hypothetical protein
MRLFQKSRRIRADYTGTKSLKRGGWMITNEN